MSFLNIIYHIPRRAVGNVLTFDWKVVGSNPIVVKNFHFVILTCFASLADRLSPSEWNQAVQTPSQYPFYISIARLPYKEVVAGTMSIDPYYFTIRILIIHALWYEAQNENN